MEWGQLHQLCLKSMSKSIFLFQVGWVESSRDVSENDKITDKDRATTASLPALLQCPAATKRNIHQNTVASTHLELWSIGSEAGTTCNINSVTRNDSACLRIIIAQLCYQDSQPRRTPALKKLLSPKKSPTPYFKNPLVLAR